MFCLKSTFNLSVLIAKAVDAIYSILISKFDKNTKFKIKQVCSPSIMVILQNSL